MAAIMRQKRKQILTITLLAGLFAVLPAAARAEALVETIVTDPLTGVALEGYDPVSYFTDAAPQPGSADYEYEWQGVSWYFASAANRDVFMRNPDIYAPQFGGHCVMSLSRGFLSDGQPRLYVIDKMKLYLFYSPANREAFLAGGGTTLTEANANWSKLEPGLTREEPSVAVAVQGAPADTAH